MAGTQEQTVEAPAAGAGGIDAGANSWAMLATCGGAHILHDGLTALTYLLLPVWAKAFALTLVQAAACRSAYVISMAVFQVPVTFVSERIGERGLLVAGTALAGLAFLLLGWAGGFAALLMVLVLAGLGSSVQHPLASSLVSGAFEKSRRRTALGVYNFTGDLGKMLLPGLVALSLGTVPWQSSTAAVGVLSLGAAGALLLLLRKLKPSHQPEAAAAGAAAAAAESEGEGKRKHGEAPAKPASSSGGGGWGILDPFGFTVLSLIGVVDSATRGGFLVLLPFLLLGKGASLEMVGLALTLVFAGGACGKFVCGILAERLGIVRTVLITELCTAAGIFLAIHAPLEWEVLLLPLLGVALNGTSSVLYATVADLVTPERRARAFAVFYTVITGASGVAPILYGAIGDHAGIPTACGIMAATVLLTLPIALRLRT